MDRLAQEMQHEADLELAKRRLIAEGFSDVFDTSVFLETERAQAKNTPFRQRDVDEDEDEAQDNQQNVSGAPLALTNLDQDEEHKTTSCCLTSIKTCPCPTVGSTASSATSIARFCEANTKTFCSRPRSRLWMYRP